MAILGVGANRSPVLYFYNKERGVQATVTFNQDGKPIISLISDNKFVWQAP